MRHRQPAGREEGRFQANAEVRDLHYAAIGQAQQDGMSRPSNSMAADVGSTSRLMQRIRIDFPVPDEPMMAVMSAPSMSSEMSRNTGLPGTYS